jgi:putative hydrolase of the HAD superfamily
LERYLSELRHLVEEAPFRTAPGALDLLRSLSEEGYRLAVISNTVGEPGAFLRPVLRSMGFERYVESYTFSDELPWAKPSPEVFRKALGELETPPSETVHAGDGWSDIEGARRAHLRAGILYSGLPEYGARYQELFFPHGRTAPEAEYHASDLEEVGRLVRTILPRPRLSP